MSQLMKMKMLTLLFSIRTFVRTLMTRQHHRLRWHICGVFRANHYLSSPDSTEQDHLCSIYTFVRGKSFYAIGYGVAVIEPQDEHTTDRTFRRFHILSFIRSYVEVDS